MTYAEALAYLNGFVNFERAAPKAPARKSFSLDRLRELAACLGNPQDIFPSLHVAGTKGKGSTCAFTHAILSAAGLKTGLYTSPHLIDVRERIRVGEALIPEGQFAEHMARCQPFLEEMRARPPGTRRPTYFEIMTHLAFMHFAAEKVDVAVVEVGMGGRLDATNILAPVACAITNISLDHTTILGADVVTIAREKAGILKAGVPAVCAPQTDEVAAEIQRIADEVGAPLERVGRELELSVTPAESSADASTPGLPRLRATLRGPDGFFAEATLGLAGQHQAENWALAVRLAHHYFARVREETLPAEALRDGSANVCWPGRLEEWPRAPGEARVFLDGAHNDASLRAALRALKDGLPPGTPLVALFGCAADKNVAHLLHGLADAADEAVFTHSGNPRGVAVDELLALWQRATDRPGIAEARLDAALAEASRRAQMRGGAVLAVGSLYLVGALKEILAADER